MLSLEQRLQMLIGVYTFQITAREIEIEQLKAENIELKAQLHSEFVAKGKSE